MSDITDEWPVAVTECGIQLVGQTKSWNGKRAGGISGVVVIVLVVCAVWDSNSLLVTPCDTGLARDTRRLFHPVDVVVAPWKGRHHVYGIFTIPDQVVEDEHFAPKLRINGIDVPFSMGEPEKADTNNLAREVGASLWKIYVPTRTAIWFFTTGQLQSLRNSCQWKLVVENQAR